MVSKRVLSALVTLFFYTVWGADAFMLTVQEIPPCGLTCILAIVPLSSCRTVANTTCICNNVDLQADIQTCLQTDCTVLEAIGTLLFCRSESRP